MTESEVVYEANRMLSFGSALLAMGVLLMISSVGWIIESVGEKYTAISTTFAGFTVVALVVSLIVGAGYTAQGFQWATNPSRESIRKTIEAQVGKLECEVVNVRWERLLAAGFSAPDPSKWKDCSR